MGSGNNIAVIISAVDQTGAVFQSVNKGLNSVKDTSDALLHAMEALGAGFIVEQFVEMAKSAAENADALERMSQKVGMSVEFLSKLEYGAKLNEIQLDQLTVGLGKFDNALTAANSGNAKASGAFNALGIDIKKAMAEGQNAEQILLRVMQRFSETADNENKTTIATVLFGKAGRDLVPLLNEGASGFAKFSEEAERSGNVLSTQGAVRAKEMHDELERLRLKAEGAALQFTLGLVPAVDAVAKSLDNATNSAEGFWSKLGQTAGMKGAGMILGLEYALDQFKLGNTSDAAEKAAIRKDMSELESRYASMIRQYSGAVDTSLVASHGDGVGSFTSKSGKPSLGLPSTEDTAKAAKARVDLLKAMGDQQVLISEETAKADLAALELEKEQGLVTVQDYWTQRRDIVVTAAQEEIDALAKKYQDQKAVIDKMAAGPKRDEATVQLIKTQDELFKKEYELAAADDQLTAQRIKNEREVGFQLTAIEAEISAAKDQGAEVAIAAIQKEFDAKRRLLTSQGIGTGGLDDLERMKIAAAEAESVRQKIDSFYADMQLKISAIQNAMANHVTSEIDGQKQIQQVQAATAHSVDGLVTRYQQLAQESNDPKLLQAAAQIEQHNSEMESQMSDLDKSFVDAGQSGLENFYGTILSGSSKGQNVFKTFIDSMISDLSRLIAKMFAVWTMQKLLGWFAQGASGAGGGGFGGGVSGDMGADNLDFNPDIVPVHGYGGSMAAGEMGIVGDRGPELWVPNTAGHIIPNNQLGGGGGRQVIYADFRGADPGSEGRITQQIQAMGMWARRGAVADVFDINGRRG